MLDILAILQPPTITPTGARVVRLMNVEEPAIKLNLPRESYNLEYQRKYRADNRDAYNLAVRERRKDPVRRDRINRLRRERNSRKVGSV